MQSNRQERGVVQGTFNFEEERASGRAQTFISPASQALGECLEKIKTNSQLTKDEKTLASFISTTLLSFHTLASRIGAHATVTFLDLTNGEKKDFPVKIIAREQEVHAIRASDLKIEFLAGFKEAIGIDLHEYLLKTTKIKFDSEVESRFLVKAYQALLAEGIKKIVLEGLQEHDSHDLILSSGDESLDASFQRMLSQVESRTSQKSLSEMTLADADTLLTLVAATMIDCHYTSPQRYSAGRIFSTRRLREAENYNHDSLR